MIKHEFKMFLRSFHIISVHSLQFRSTSSGLLLGIGRIAAILGNQVFGQLVNVNCAVPMIMVVVFLGFGGLSAIKLPNMTRKDLL